MLNTYYWKWDKVIEPSFCQYIINSADWDKAKKGEYETPDGNMGKDSVVRDTDIIFYNEAHPLFCVLQSFILKANALANWNYDLSGFEHVQLGKYVEKGHYEWHSDIFKPDEANMQRKLTAVLLLSDKQDYEGGNLEFSDTQDKSPLQEIGSIIVFPSFLKHRVNPVLKGVRYSAVCWAVGPTFR